MGIQWKTYDAEKSFTEQAAPPLPPEARYNVTLTNVEYKNSDKGSRITFEETIDSGPIKGHQIEEGFWFPNSGKQDYAIATMNAIFLAAGYTPTLPDGDTEPATLAAAFPINVIRWSVECVHKYQITAWAERKDYKDPGMYDTEEGCYIEDESGWCQADKETYEAWTGPKRYLRAKLYMDVDKAAFDRWTGKKYSELVPRRGGYTDMTIIYGPVNGETERKTFTPQEEFVADNESDLPF